MDLILQLDDTPMPPAPGVVGQPVEQQRARQGRVSDEQVVKNKQPSCGLLSHTVIPSPVIQWVLPARLRSRHRHDVVVVGERHLQIKEALSDIHLEDVITKSDFGANIVAAKVIDVGAERSWETQMKLGSGNPTATANSDMQDNLPPQMLVLSLDSRELVFLYYSELDGGQFIHCHRPLPSDVSPFEKFGRNVKVDPMYARQCLIKYFWNEN